MSFRKFMVFRRGSLFAVSKSLVRNHGFHGFFNGLSATLLCSIPSTGMLQDFMSSISSVFLALYFAAYEGVKLVGVNTLPKELAPAIHLTAGAASELVASIIVVPFEVAKSRMQLVTLSPLFEFCFKYYSILGHWLS